MKTLHNQIQKVEVLNSQLVSERSKLNERAVLQYEDLTPRPIYNSIFEDTGLFST